MIIIITIIMIYNNIYQINDIDTDNDNNNTLIQERATLLERLYGSFRDRFIFGLNFPRLPINERYRCPRRHKKLPEVFAA